MDANDNLEMALYHILSVWMNYGDGATWYRSDAGSLRVDLPHKNMQAGESAGDFLELHGLTRDIGYSHEVTDKGAALIDKGQSLDW